jgi:YesN/AraC family two-component response regulator
MAARFPSKTKVRDHLVKPVDGDVLERVLNLVAQRIEAA